MNVGSGHTHSFLLQFAIILSLPYAFCFCLFKPYKNYTRIIFYNEKKHKLKALLFAVDLFGFMFNSLTERKPIQHSYYLKHRSHRKAHTGRKNVFLNQRKRKREREREREREKTENINTLLQILYLYNT